MQAEVAALALAVAGGAALLLCGVALARRRRGRGLPAGARALLGAVPDALGDASILLDGDGRVVASSAVARLRFAHPAVRGRSVKELLGEQADLLRRGLGRGPASGWLALPGAEPGSPPVHAVLVRVAARPVRELLVLRFAEPRPPPLPAPLAAPTRQARAVAHADLAALGVVLERPVRQAATAAGLLRLALPSTAAPEELDRLERALGEAERRIRWLRASRDGPPRLAAVDLAELVGDLLGGVPAGRARLRAQLAPAPAFVDAARVRAALREVLRAAAEALPAGGEVIVRVGVRSGAAVLELASAAAASAAGEAAALARALLAPEGGEVELEAVPGRGGVCRISLPTVA